MTHSSEPYPPRNLAQWLLADRDPAAERAEQAIAAPLAQSPVTVLSQLGAVARGISEPADRRRPERDAAR